MAGLLDREKTERAITKAILSNGFSNFLADKVVRDLKGDPRLQKSVAKAVAGTSIIRHQIHKLGSAERYRRLSASERRVIVENVKDEIRHHICDLVCRRLTELLNSKNAITKIIDLRIRYKTKEYYDRHLTPEKIRSLLSAVESQEAPSDSDTPSEETPDDNIYGEPWRFFRLRLNGIPSIQEPKEVEAGEVQDRVVPVVDGNPELPMTDHDVGAMMEEDDGYSNKDRQDV